MTVVPHRVHCPFPDPSDTSWRAHDSVPHTRPGIRLAAKALEDPLEFPEDFPEQLLEEYMLAGAPHKGAIVSWSLMRCP